MDIPLDSKTFLSRHSMDMKFTYCDDRWGPAGSVCAHVWLCLWSGGGPAPDMLYCWGQVTVSSRQCWRGSYWTVPCSHPRAVLECSCCYGGWRWCVHLPPHVCVCEREGEGETPRSPSLSPLRFLGKEGLEVSPLAQPVRRPAGSLETALQSRDSCVFSSISELFPQPLLPLCPPFQPVSSPGWKAF